MTLRQRFSPLVDPRLRRSRRYPLSDIVLLVLCGLLVGANDCVGIVEWGKAKRTWLSEKLQIERIPSHDTLCRVLARLDSSALAECLAHWSQTLWQAEPGEVVAFDGKVLRGALGNLNLMSAFASSARLVVALRKVGDDSNEIPALRELLQLLCLEGAIVTADAMHGQIATAQAIVDKKADYVLALKKNQGGYYEAATEFFQKAREGNFVVGKQKVPYRSCQQVEKAHGRVETRRCYAIETTAWFDPLDRWPDLKGVVLVEREYRVQDPKTREERRVCEQRYFVTSLFGSATQVLRAVRRHWRIENSQHWLLDVFFREDDSRLRVGDAAQNMGIFRRQSLNLLRREKTAKVGIANKRVRAAADDTYLEILLATE